MKIDWRRKPISRKFWLAITAFVVLLIVTLGGSQETATRVAALIMAGASVRLKVPVGRATYAV